MPQCYGALFIVQRNFALHRRIGFRFQRCHHQRGVLVIGSRHHGFAAISQPRPVQQHLKHPLIVDLQRQHACQLALAHDRHRDKSRDCIAGRRIQLKLRDIAFQRAQRIARDFCEAAVAIGTGEQVGGKIGFMGL